MQKCGKLPKFLSYLPFVVDGLDAAEESVDVDLVYTHGGGDRGLVGPKPTRAVSNGGYGLILGYYLRQIVKFLFYSPCCESAKSGRKENTAGDKKHN